MTSAYIILMIVFSAVGGAVISFFIFLFASRALLSLKMSKRVETARYSEEEAEALLKKKGFKIIDRQKRTDIITYIDGKPNLGYVQADFIVEKSGKRYVAEVKAGEMVSDPTEPSTRRQLLEYKFAYEPYGILLVNMLDRSLHQIDFDLPSPDTEKTIRLILAALIVIIVLGIIWIFASIKVL